MAKNAVVEFIPLWFDVSAPWLTFGTIFKWCDAAQGTMFPKDSSQQVLRQLHNMWSTSSMMRTNTARLFLHHHDELRNSNRIRIRPFLQDVGRTSYVCGFRISDASPQETLLAAVETVMVNTDTGLTKSAPIPNVEKVRKLVDTSQAVAGLGRPDFASSSSQAVGGEVYNFSTMARLTDTDSLGHINNAIYANLAEEFRHYAARQGGYGDSEAASYATRPATTCSISYIDQARPFDPLDVTTWALPTETGFDYHFDVHVGGTLVTQMMLGVERNNLPASKI